LQCEPAAGLEMRWKIKSRLEVQSMTEIWDSEQRTE
jgi:hypothetical protein